MLHQLRMTVRWTGKFTSMSIRYLSCNVQILVLKSWMSFVKSKCIQNIPKRLASELQSWNQTVYEIQHLSFSKLSDIHSMYINPTMSVSQIISWEKVNVCIVYSKLYRAIWYIYVIPVYLRYQHINHSFRSARIVDPTTFICKEKRIY